MNTGLPTLFLLLCSSIGLLADMVVLRNGREYEGELVRATEEQIFFRRGDEVEVYRRDEVIHIRLQSKRRWDEADRVEDIDDRLLRASVGQVINPARFPGAGTYTHYRQTTIDLHDNGTWKKRVRRIVRVLSEHGESASINSQTFRSDAENVEIIHGISVRPDGTVAHLRDTAIQMESLQGQEPRYDRVKRMRLALPEGKPGVLLDSAIATTRYVALPLEKYYDEFLFGGADPAGRIEVSISVPASITLRWQLLNDPDATVILEKGKIGESTTYTWSRTHAPLLTPEPLMPPWSDLVPRLVVAADCPDQWSNALSGAEGDRRDLGKAAPPCPVPDLDPVELRDYLSRQVRDVGADLLAMGREPGNLDEAWRLRRASALDRAALLCGWLRQSGFTDVRLSWIRPRSHGALAKEIVSLSAFSIPVVYVPGADVRFLVPGDELSTAFEMVAELGGSWALVPGEGLVNVPPPEPEAAGIDRHVEVELNRRGKAHVKEQITYRGQACREVRAWRKLTAREIRKKIESMVAGKMPGADDIRYEILGDPGENAGTIGLLVTYAVDDFAAAGKSLTSAKMPWFEYSAWAVGRDKRRFPFHWVHPRLDRIAVEVKAPESWTLAAAPEAMSKSRPPGMSLTVKSNSVGPATRCSLRYRRQILDAPPDIYTDLKDLLESRAEMGARYWVWEQ